MAQDSLFDLQGLKLKLNPLTSRSFCRTGTVFFFLFFWNFFGYFFLFQNILRLRKNGFDAALELDKKCSCSPVWSAWNDSIVLGGRFTDSATALV